MRLQQNRMLSSIDRVLPGPRAIARVRSGRNSEHYAAVIAAYDKLVALVEHIDRQAVREAVEDAGLVAAEEPILFELLITFKVIDTLNAAGWKMEPFTLFAGHVHTTGSMPDGRQISFWYQTTPHDLVAASQYLGILAAHDFTMSRPLRPDIVLQWTDPDGEQRWLLIECKLITSQSRAVNSAARQALADLLQYRSDFDVALGTTRAPYGLGVAWGEGLQPNLNSDIVLCTPDTLDHAIRHITTGGLPARSFTRLTWWRVAACALKLVRGQRADVRAATGLGHRRVCYGSPARRSPRRVWLAARPVPPGRDPAR